MINARKNTSWAKLEGRVDDPKLISVSKEKMDPPPLTVMSLSVKTYLNSKITIMKLQ